MKKNFSILVVVILVLSSCATTKKQIKSVNNQLINEEKTLHTFYLIGDCGNTGSDSKVLNNFTKEINNVGQNATTLFLGDNIYPKGLSEEENPSRKKQENILDKQIQSVSDFKGKTIFIPGNHDWYNDGLKGLKRQEDYIENKLGNGSFQPQNGCPLKVIDVNDSIALFIIDSQWYLTDWDKHPNINEKCSIKNRFEFFNELKSELNKNQNKFTIIAMHHPIITNGAHGGYYSFQKQLYPLRGKTPLPILGSLVNFLRKTSGANPQDTQNKIYQELVNNIKPMIQNRKNVLVVSGHDHNLQYLESDGVKQVVSGSGSKNEAAKVINQNDFSFGGNGFCEIKIFKNQNAQISFYNTENNFPEKIHTVSIQSTTIENSKVSFIENNNQIVKASIYSNQETKKSKLYKFLWGDYYRDYYNRMIDVKSVKLDTLYGGLKPTISGGGNQSESLRLVDNEGKDYVMRALKKSPTRFLQSAFRDQNAIVDFKDTYAEAFILDFYTTAHPYTPFVIGKLANKIKVYNTNPKLYFIPKQTQLGKFNNDFGDKLYLVEERPTDKHLDLESFGKPQNILGTEDLLENLRKDEKYQIDETAYLRARLFDMFIGDWDRHQDQWRWAEFEDNGKVIYKPIPRDRDQAFAKVDGYLMSILLKIPGVRHITNFKSKYPSEKWFNYSANSLDIALIKNATEEDWKTQARNIVEELNDEALNEAFSNLPQEIRNDKTTLSIINTLKLRRNGLEHFALSYYKFLQKRVIITGSDKRDKFLVENLPNRETKISWSRIKNGKDELISTMYFNKKQTKEIWIYSLGDEDQFKVIGKNKNHCIIRLIGGQNKDSYEVENGKNLKIYDYKSKENTVAVDKNTKVYLEDNYELNEYHYKKPKYNHTFFLPLFGFNPDDGMKIIGNVNYVKQGFINSPFSEKHNFSTGYYFATQGVELKYNSTITRVFKNWNFEMEARYTTPNFSINYFGYGNETKNFDDFEGMDFNRVKIQILKFSPSLKYVGRMGGEVTLQTSFENIEVEKTTNRFINLSDQINPDVFNYQQFAGSSIKYAFKNYDREANPTLGMRFAIQATWKANLSDVKQNFSYWEAELGFSHYLINSKKLVLGTLLKSKLLTNNNFEFYQAATLGGDYDLRGFRNERFLGKSSYFQSTDLRWNIGKIKGIVPMQYGVLGGYDYGRVWLDGETSNKCHQSVGGGVWLSGLDLITARLTFFNSDDGNRIAFGLGFGF